MLIALRINIHLEVCEELGICTSRGRVFINEIFSYFCLMHMR